MQPSSRPAGRPLCLQRREPTAPSGDTSALATALGISAGYLVSRTRFSVAVFDPLSGLVRAARSMSADGWRLFWLVMLPGSLPVILGGLRLALVAGLLSILRGDVIASLSGLGDQIVAYSDAMETARMLAYVLLAFAIATSKGESG